MLENTQVAETTRTDTRNIANELLNVAEQQIVNRGVQDAAEQERQRQEAELARQYAEKQRMDLAKVHDFVQGGKAIQWQKTKTFIYDVSVSVLIGLVIGGVVHSFVGARSCYKR